MSYELHPAIPSLFRMLLQIPSNARIFIPTVDDSPTQLEIFDWNGQCVSAVSTHQNAITYKWDSAKVMLRSYENPHNMAVVTKKPELIHPKGHDGKGEFHFAFGFPQVNDDGSYIWVEDELRQYHISRYSKTHHAPLHLLRLEAMGDAVKEGCFFGAVLPKRYIQNMRYMKWWSGRFALVAKITLPLTAVERYYKPGRDTDEFHQQKTGLPTHYDFETRRHLRIHKKLSLPLTELPHLPDPLQFSLLIWHKTADQDHLKLDTALAWATQRYPLFTAKLQSLHEEHTEMVASMFRKHEWNKLSVHPLLRLLSSGKISEYHIDTTRGGSHGGAGAIELPDPDKVRTIKVPEEKRPRYIVASSSTEIARDRFAVQIKPVMPLKLCTYSIEATAALMEIRSRAGFDSSETRRASTEDDYLPMDEFTSKFKSVAFSDQREWLLKELCAAGLQPYMTEQDHSRIENEEKWLNLQLTPIKRTVMIPTEVEGEMGWEKMYDDIDIKATYPQLWDMWDQRAKKMRMDKVKITGSDGVTQPMLAPFQYDNVLTMCCKQSLLHSDVMGLGKTRVTLLAMLLRGVERGLIVCPSRLIGVWQEEIEKTITQYIRLVPKNWMGKMQRATYRVISTARDTLPEHMKTFNLVSYENLPKVPKDAAFYVCGACKTVVCSPLGMYQEKAEQRDYHPCPKCNEGKTQNWIEQNKKDGLRKYKLHGGVTVDERLSTRKIVMMERTENQWDKLVKRQKAVKKADRHGYQTVTTEEVMEKKDVHLKWTFSELLRHRCSMIAIEEANYVANPDTNRAIALNHLTARTRVALTGTPVRGYPKSVCNVLNWTLRKAVWPDYRPKKGGEDGIRKFERKYATYVMKMKLDGTQSQKLMPKINQAEMFQQELSPHMLRHTRFEPEVASVFPPQMPELDAMQVPMDAEHKRFYQAWLEKFAEWWKEKKRTVDKVQVGDGVKNDLMVKLGYLRNASTCPHTMMDGLGEEAREWAEVIGPYKGPPTQKFLACGNLVKKYIQEGDKTIVFADRRANLKWLWAWCNVQKPRVKTLKRWVDGSVSNHIDFARGKTRSDKQLMVDEFCRGDYDVLLAGIGTMKEGYNIWQANRGIFYDYTWTPADWEQALARMLRPQQKKVVHGMFMTHKGTVEDYMAAYVLLKGKAAQEGVDYQAYDFKADEVPDFAQYADAIVDGTEEKVRAAMWEEVEDLKKRIEEGGI